MTIEKSDLRRYVSCVDGDALEVEKKMRELIALGKATRRDGQGQQGVNASGYPYKDIPRIWRYFRKRLVFHHPTSTYTTIGLTMMICQNSCFYEGCLIIPRNLILLYMQRRWFLSFFERPPSRMKISTKILDNLCHMEKKTTMLVAIFD